MTIVDKILKLKKEKNAVLLVHNYQLPEIQDIADFVGDSLNLSVQASKTNADVIVFCGVYFMAETAKIISPQKTVLIPDKDAGCPMADMITVDQLRELKKRNPGAMTVCYVNTSAEVKAECDVCCTSANAVEVVQGILKQTDKVIFVPDKYLGGFVARTLSKDLICWQGYCPTHAKILDQDIFKAKKAHPAAQVLVHPECNAEVIKAADKALSTEGMCRYVRQSSCKEFIIGTEIGIIHRLKKDNPDKDFYPASELGVCPNMKKTTLEKVLYSLENMYYRVELPEDIIKSSQKSIQEMLKYTGKKSSKD